MLALIGAEPAISQSGEIFSQIWKIEAVCAVKKLTSEALTLKQDEVIRNHNTNVYDVYKGMNSKVFHHKFNWIKKWDKF